MSVAMGSDGWWLVGTLLGVGWTVGIFCLGYSQGAKDERERRGRWR